VEHIRGDHARGLDKSGIYGRDAFGLGVGIVSDPAGLNGELGAPGAYGWGGAAGTQFWIDPVDDIVGIFVVQSIPHQTPLADKFQVLTYQALID